MKRIVLKFSSLCKIVVMFFIMAQGTVFMTSCVDDRPNEFVGKWSVETPYGVSSTVVFFPNGKCVEDPGLCGTVYTTSSYGYYGYRQNIKYGKSGEWSYDHINRTIRTTLPNFEKITDINWINVVDIDSAAVDEDYSLCWTGRLNGGHTVLKADLDNDKLNFINCILSEVAFEDYFEKEKDIHDYDKFIEYKDYKYLIKGLRKNDLLFCFNDMAYRTEFNNKRITFKENGVICIEDVFIDIFNVFKLGNKEYVKKIDGDFSGSIFIENPYDNNFKLNINIDDCYTTVDSDSNSDIIGATFSFKGRWVNDTVARRKTLLFDDNHTRILIVDLEM